jgi:hypothetical protein
MPGWPIHAQHLAHEWETKPLKHFPSRCRDALPDEQRALARVKKGIQGRA